MSEQTTVYNSLPGDKCLELTVLWDPISQAFGVKFDTKDFKDWGFVIAAIEGGLDHAKDKKLEERVAKMRKLEQAAMEQQAVQQMLQQGGQRRVIQA